MNTQFANVSFAIAFSLSLGLGVVGLAAHAVHHGQVVNLGTIQVTAADVEGGNRNIDLSKLGSTAYLGVVDVTADDSPASRLAAREAAKHGAVYLGVVEVRANAGEDARYAANLAKSPGTASLGTIRVTTPNVTSLLFAGVPKKSADSFAVLKFISALAFGRAGG